MQQAAQYLGRKEYSEAIGLCGLPTDFPRFASAYIMLAKAHLAPAISRPQRRS